jgi:hypothetical protein
LQSHQRSIEHLRQNLRNFRFANASLTFKKQGSPHLKCEEKSGRKATVTYILSLPQKREATVNTVRE